MLQRSKKFGKLQLENRKTIYFATRKQTQKLYN